MVSITYALLFEALNDNQGALNSTHIKSGFINVASSGVGLIRTIAIIGLFVGVIGVAIELVISKTGKSIEKAKEHFISMIFGAIAVFSGATLVCIAIGAAI